MKKRIVYFLIPFILGCNFLFPQPEVETAAPPTQIASVTVQPIESTPQAESAPAFTVTRIHLANGELYDQLAVYRPRVMGALSDCRGDSRDNGSTSIIYWIIQCFVRIDDQLKKWVRKFIDGERIFAGSRFRQNIWNIAKVVY